MKTLRTAGALSVAALIVLGLLALVLSALALTRFRGTEATAGPPVATPSTTSSAQESGSPAPVPAESPTPSGEPEATPSSETPRAGDTVVVIGDSYSVGEAADTWVGAVSEALGWSDVVNLSSPGRGYVTAPRSCDFDPCANFTRSITLVTDAEPDLVITFGGTADGDYSLAGPADTYFEALREALPDAQLVAINPITTDDRAEYWLTLHGRTIRAAVEAVDGTFVDVGQPGLGDGETLSAEAQADIAQQVIDQLG